MPLLNGFQKAVILTRLTDDVGMRTIAQEIHINKNTVLRAKHKFEQMGILQRKHGSNGSNNSRR